MLGAHELEQSECGGESNRLALYAGNGQAKFNEALLIDRHVCHLQTGFKIGHESHD